MVTLCYEAGDLAELDSVVAVLSRKRSILKLAVAGMVQKCMEWVPLTGDRASRLALLATIRSVTEGKIYLEAERARATRTLADMLEREDGKTVEAAEIMQEVQVETFGSLEKREKVDFILEQMRLSIAVSHFQKALLISRKLTTKTFETPGFQDLRLRYLDLMILLSLHDEKYLDCCKHYHAIYTTKLADSPADPSAAAAATAALKLAVIFVVLAPFSNEQSDLMNKLFREKPLADLALYREFLRTFLSKEILRWPVVQQAFGDELRAFPQLFGTDADSVRRWQHLCERVIEHNTRTIAAFYSQITLKRFAELLDLEQSEAERVLCKLVTGKMVQAKIDRILAVVDFEQAKSADGILNSWSSRVDSLLSLMVKTSHQIGKEEMLHVPAATAVLP